VFNLFALFFSKDKWDQRFGSGNPFAPAIYLSRERGARVPGVAAGRGKI